MIAVNIYMLLPLIEKKKPKQYEQLNTIINKQIDGLITTIPYIGRIERQKKAASD